MNRKVEWHQSFGSTPINVPSASKHSTIGKNTDKVRYHVIFLVLILPLCFITSVEKYKRREKISKKFGIPQTVLLNKLNTKIR